MLLALISHNGLYSCKDTMIIYRINDYFMYYLFKEDAYYKLDHKKAWWYALVYRSAVYQYPYEYLISKQIYLDCVYLMKLTYTGKDALLSWLSLILICLK